MQVFDINLAPGAVRLVDQLADYIYFLNGSAGGADTTIVIRPETGGDAVYLRPGQAYKFNLGEAAARWSISNLKGEGAIVGQLLFSVGTFTDNRVSGSVEVIDGGRSRTNAGQAFTAHLYTQAVAACISAVQLYNPPGSGKNILINQIQGVIGGGYSLQMKLHNASIDGSGTAGSGTVGSKKSGGPASIALPVCLANSSGLSPIASPPFAMANAQTLRLSEPYLLSPGWGLVCASPVVNNACGAELEFFEEPV